MSFNDTEWGSTWTAQPSQQPQQPPAPINPTTNAANLENEIFSECHSQITRNIQQLTSLFDEIKGNLQFLGKRADNRAFRESLNERMSLAMKLLKDTHNALKRLDGIASKSQRQKEKKQKVAKLTQDIDSKLNGPFQQLFSQAKKMMDEIPIPVTAAFNSNSSDEKNQLLEEDYQQYYKIADETAFQDGIVYEREKDIAGIQRQVVEVNEIFRDLGRMIAEQNPQIENIRTHISDVVDNVKTADSEVTEADSLLSSSRKKLCFVSLGILLVIAICVVVVVVVLKGKGQL